MHLPHTGKRGLARGRTPTGELNDAEVGSEESCRGRRNGGESRKSWSGTLLTVPGMAGRRREADSGRKWRQEAENNVLGGWEESTEGGRVRSPVEKAENGSENRESWGKKPAARGGR